ncbi:hypothetical protein AAG906_038042 [Vitis piasezkii]
MQGEKQGEEENRVKKNRGQHPFSTFYIPFQSSGSQESNASNATRYMPQAGTLRTSRWKPISQPCEFSLVLKLFAALLCLEISQTPFSPAKWFSSFDIFNLKAFKSPGPTLGKASDFQPWKCTSLPEPLVGERYEPLHGASHERDLVFEPINGKHLYNTGAPAGHESTRHQLGTNQMAPPPLEICDRIRTNQMAPLRDVVHAILNTIAEEAMNFMSYMAEVSRGWDEPNARDMGRMTYGKEIGKARNDEYATRQAISKTPLQAMPCAICLSYEHLGMSVLPFQPKRKCLVIATPTIPIEGPSKFLLETTAT